MWRKIGKFLFAVYYFPVFFLITMIVGWAGRIIGLFSLEAGRYWSLKVWGWAVLSCAFVRVKTAGLENLPPASQGGAIIYANHQAYTDIPALAVASPRPLAFVAKKDLLKIPFLGGQVAQMHYPIARGNYQETQALLLKGLDNIKKGGLMAIFPEGTRNRTDRTLLPFKKGAFIMARESGAPLVPVAISGTSRVWPAGDWAPLWGTLTLTFGPPLYPEPGENLAALTKRARGALLTMRGGLKPSDLNPAPLKPKPSGPISGETSA